MTTSSPQPTGSNTFVRRIATAAVLIAIGNVASRFLGLIREAVIAQTFSISGAVDAFTAASLVPTTLYDLLINGAISAALVPVFSEYAEGDEREFWRVASTMINLAVLMLSFATLISIWQAPLVISVLAGGFDEEISTLATDMVRWMMPSVIFVGLSGLITALLHSRQRFLLPSFTASAYNIGIIIGAVALTPLLDPVVQPFSLVAGVILGSLFQVFLQLPGLRGISYQFILDLRHPGVRRILLLYAPVAMGISFSIAGMILDRNLASNMNEGTIATMRFATTLIQFPLGLVAAAVSFAVLPTLSRQVSAGDETGFRTTLAMGIKVVLLLILPATAGLAALSTPIVALVFEGNEFRAEQTAIVVAALLLYLPGLPAAAVDQMLLFGFYAHRRTLTPNLVQGAAVGFYAITAFTLMGFGLRIEALILGNSAQWIAHMLVLLVLSRGLFSLRGLGIATALLKCTIASLALAGVAWGLASALEPLGRIVQFLVAGSVASAVYFGVCMVLRVEALTFFTRAVQQRLRRKNGS
ncbi:MAG: murein biosynthesis integral membrane protein MurJ [Chloroflexota bacterium]